MVNIFQQKDKGTKFFSVRYNFLIISLEEVGDKKLMSVSLVVFIVKGHKSKGIILIDSVELDLFNSILMYMQHGRVNNEIAGSYVGEQFIGFRVCYNQMFILTPTGFLSWT